MPRTLLVATRKGLFRCRRRGKGSWRLREPDFLGVPVSQVLQDQRDGALYAALDHGHFGVKLHRSDDGDEWQEVAVPVYPEPPAGEAQKDGVGRPLPWTLKLVWSLETDGTADGALWAGTLPGGLFRSPDRGQTWQLLRTLWDRPERARWFGGGYDQPGIHSILVHPEDPKVVVLGVSCGGVWRTADAGASWELVADGMRASYTPPDQAGEPAIQDPHRLAWCAGQPNRIWCQHHNGIFRTRKDGRTWRELKGKGSPSTFGFAVAAHPEDPDVAWFAPARKDECRVPVDGRLVVTRTRDGGKTFETLARGLPEAPSYDLVYRHGLVVADDGATLAMGSTTGGLWVSEDAGKTWSEVGGRMPPIYALRFGVE